MENWLIYILLLGAGMIIGSLRGDTRREIPPPHYSDNYYYREPMAYRPAHRPYNPAALILVLLTVGAILISAILQ